VDLMGRQLKLAQVESEILQYSSSANFPQPTGSIKYLYLDQSANTLYRWDALSGLNGEYVLLNSATTPPTSGSAEGELYFADLVTSARLMPCTYNNGVSGSGATLISTGSIALGQFNQPGKIDNTTPLADDIILVRSEAAALRNGLYSITDLGSPTSSFVLTRVSYYDTGSEVYPSQITGLRGTTGANQTYIQQTPNPIIGTSSIVFSQSPSTSTQTLPILFIDTVTTAPLPLSTYASGSTYVGFPGAGATLTATASGALGVIGGVTASSGVRLLAVSESNPVRNGSYTVTAPGSATTPWKLTRIDYWTSMQPNVKEFVVSRFGATEYGSRYVLQSSSITPANIGISQALIFQKYLYQASGSGGSSIPAFPFTGSATITGSLTVTGSIVATTGFTGSLLGTASFAQTASYALNAVSSSYAATASLAPLYLPLTGGTISGNVSVLGTASIAFLNVTYESASVIYSSGSNQFGDATNDTQTLIGRTIVSGSLEVTGSANLPSITGSLFGTASFATTSSYALNALSASWAPSVSPFPFTGSALITGSLGVTGSVNVSGSTTQIGNNTLVGQTNLSGSIYVSGSINALADLTLAGTFRLDPAQDPGGTNLTASFLFTSASNTAQGYDLYYRQYGNLVKFKWLEGGISSGLLYGGIISASGATIYVSSGSGVILDPNASFSSEINPQFTYVTWPNYSASATYLTSSQNTYIYVDSVGTIHQQIDFFDQTQYEQAIPLGRATHPNYSTITGVGSNVQTTYDSDSQQSAFIRAFGPLKIDGFSINAHPGTLGFGIGNGVAFQMGGFYPQNPNSPSHYHGNAFATSSIARAYRSGSGVRLDNNGGAFYTTVDPDYWDDGTGVLNTMAAGDWQIQRVFANPVTGRVVIYYGQNIYTTKINALQYLATDSFTEGEFTAHSLIFVGYLVLKGQTNNLTDATNNSIINGGIFRNIAGGSSSGGAIAQTLNDLGDVTITTPSNGQALIYNSGIWENGTPILATTASYVLNAVSASFATSASYAPDTTFPYTGSAIVTGSIILTGSLQVAVPSTAGAASELARFKATDSTSTLQIINYATNQGVFVPTIRTLHSASSTSVGLQLIAQIGNDGATNTNPAMTFLVMSQSAAVGQIRNRPLFAWENNNTSSMALTTVGLAIGTNLLTPSASLHVNNTSSFNSFLVEDDTRPDASPFVIDNVGRVGIGKLSPSASLDITGSVLVTGSVSITQNVSASRASISSSNGTVSGSTLTVFGSGSTLPVFTVQGSQGELFSVTDSFSGSLFSVNDISGIPILGVFSDRTTLIGDFQDPMLITTAKTVQTNSGSFIVYSLPTASYDTAFFEYSVRSGSNARAGTIMAIQSGSAVNFAETTTTDFGSTSAVSFTVIITGSNMALTGSSTSGAWTTKCIIRGL